VRKYKCETNADLDAFLRRHLKTTKKEWDNVKDEHEIIVLSSFEYEQVDSETGKRTKARGFCFTSKKIFTNAKNCYLHQNAEGIVLIVDGKFVSGPIINIFNLFIRPSYNAIRYL
jgi:hypothetical protein